MLNGNGMTAGADGTPFDVNFILRGADLYGSMKNFSRMASKTGKKTGIV